jgi:hypothetical protein
MTSASDQLTYFQVPNNRVMSAERLSKDKLASLTTK